MTYLKLSTCFKGRKIASKQARKEREWDRANGTQLTELITPSYTSDYSSVQIVNVSVAAVRDKFILYQQNISI